MLAVPNSATITRMPGTNHCRVSAAGRPDDATSSGPNSPRNTSGCTRLNSALNGSRITGRSSRTKTFQMSARMRLRPGTLARCRLRRRGAPVSWSRRGVVRVSMVFMLRPPRTRVRRMRVLCCGGRLALFAQAPPGEREEHVVERRLVDRRRPRREPGGIERAQDGRQRLVGGECRHRHTVVPDDASRACRAAAAAASAAESKPSSTRSPARSRFSACAVSSAMSRRGPSPSPARPAVGLVEVVGRQEDRCAVARRAARRCAARGWRGSAGRGRWTAHRGRAAPAGG